jgi:hypothetical protein
MQFGVSSEWLARHIDQLELKLEDLEILRASRPVPAVLESLIPQRKPSRRPLPDTLPRETEIWSRKRKPLQTAVERWANWARM